MNSKGLLTIAGKVIVSCVLAASLFSPAGAEVVLDGTMGRSGPLEGPNYAITGDLGKQLGGNLFHSFQSFNIFASESATFSGPASVQNIISRVTGGNSSNIDGLFRSTIPGADLYFINPAGVIFGKDARLDVGGSFHVSTADYISLGDSGRYDATAPGNSILTIAPPSAFGFLGTSPKDISLNNSLLQVPEGKSLSLVGGNLSFENSVLHAPGGAINLVSAASAGEAVFHGSELSGDSFSEMGEIIIRNTSADPVYIDAVEIGNIDASGKGGGSIFIKGGHLVIDGATIYADTFGDRQADGVHLKANGEILISNGSYISSDTFGPGHGGTVEIISSGAVFVTGSYISTQGYDSGNSGSIFIETPSMTIEDSAWLAANTDGSGNGGSIDLNVGDLSVQGGAQINSYSTGTGHGGDITIRASDSVTISGFSLIDDSIYLSGIHNETYETGDAGNIIIETGNLTITDAGRITASARADSTGNGGSITIRARDSVTISGSHVIDGGLYLSGIINETSGTGDAGNITVETGNLTITDAGRIAANARAGSGGNGGNITINARDYITISGFHDIGNSNFSSGIFSETYGIGNAGDISVDTGTLSITDDGRIAANARSGSAGDGGNITINARDSITISGFHDLGESNFSSGIFSQTFSTGNSGDISVETGSLSITDDGTIATSARAGSGGDGGNITIKARDSITISGSHDIGETNFSSGIFNETYGKGDAGNTLIEAGSLTITDNGRITASARAGSEGNGGNITIKAKDSITISGFHDIGDSNFSSGIISETYGIGNAGSIVVETGSLSINEDGRITASARSGSEGNGGDITIRAEDSIIISGFHTIGNNIYLSGIFSETSGRGNAGNIVVETGSLDIRDAGRVAANARADSEGNGGNITIKAKDYVDISGSHTVGDSIYFSGIYGETFGKGGAGDITIEGDSLSLTDGGRIDANARAGSEGNGGNITIKTQDSVTISGFHDLGESNFSSGIFSQTFSTGNSGDIIVETGSLSLTDNGRISASARTDSEGDGGNITIQARDSVTISGFHDIGERNFSSSILSETFGKGKAGDILISTNSLIISDAGRIGASARSGSEGNGGNITILAKDSVTISGVHEIGGSIYSSGITNETFGKGNAGNIFIETDVLNCTDQGRIATTAREGSEGNAGYIRLDARSIKLLSGARIESEAYGPGSGGEIDISASESVNLSDASISTTSWATGNAGFISIITPDLDLTFGSISSSAFNDGDAGYILLKVDDLNLNDFSSILASTYGSGNGGDIEINVGRLYINDSEINSSSSSSGNGGAVRISATDSVTISGNDAGIFCSSHESGSGGFISVQTPSLTLDASALIAANTFGSGNAGNIDLTVDTLTLMNGSQINSFSQGAGHAGTVSITAADSVVMSGYSVSDDIIYNSGIFCSASGEGDAGFITIAAPFLMMDNGRISVHSSESGTGGDIMIKADKISMINGSEITSSSLGSGNAGSIVIVTGSLISESSSIMTSAEEAAGGNISITGDTIQLTKQSSVTASVASGEGGGGNVTISTTSLVALEDSDITARADQGFGGNIAINSEVVLFSEDIDLNASSYVAGREGTVEVNAPVIDFSSNIAVLPERFLNIDTLMPKRCAGREEESSSFLIRGRDGLPPQPCSLLSSP